MSSMTKPRMISLFLCAIMIATSFASLATAESTSWKDNPYATDTIMSNTTPGYPASDMPEAVAWRPIAPLNTATIIGYDPESYHDDLSYMAAIPYGVFMEDDTLYSSPVIFYDSPYLVSGDPERTLDHNKGINYFMDDWVTACGDNLSRATIMGLDAAQRDDIESTNQWFETIEDVWEINGTDARNTAYKLALDGWESSDKAVIAVLSDKILNDNPELMDAKTISGSVEGIIPAGEIENIHIEGSKAPDPQDPNYHNFTVNPSYKFMEVEMEWSDHAGGEITDRGRDPDMQVYDWQLGEVVASENWNVLSGPHEYAECYIYHDHDEIVFDETGEMTPAPWGVAVTYMPTEALPMWDPELVPVEQLLGMYGYEGDEAAELAADFERKQKAASAASGENFPVPYAEDQPAGLPGDQISDETDYRIDITMYVGADADLGLESPFMARDVSFTLEWEGSAELKFLIRGPSGAEIPFSSADNTGSSPITLTLRELGEGKYSIAAICLDDSNPEIPFNVEYEYNQYYPKSYGKSFAAAANGAVLASMNNAPLLFSTGDELDDGLQDILDTLGVTEVYLVSLMSSSGLEDGLEKMRSWMQDGLDVKELDSYKEIYQEIRGKSNQNDIIFSTLNPWTPWLGNRDNGVQDDMENPRGLYAAPAALAGAFHGAPVVFTECHKETSAAQAWHNAYWRFAYRGRYPPSVGCMVLTGRMVYDFLDGMGLDGEGLESMTTVAGQFDIGTSWDRVFVGVAAPGRIMGTPVDAAYWIARSALYPKMIFANPSVNGKVTMHTGYDIDQGTPARDVQVENVFLQSWVSYQHRFNGRACGEDPYNNYWACDYVTADGITPYHQRSPETIDDGVNAPYMPGQYWPDLTASEIVPFYGEKLGYEQVFSTTFGATMDNLNTGAVLWFEIMHGGNSNFGGVGWWNENEDPFGPWRGYEDAGSTHEPDTINMDKNTGADMEPNPFEYGWHDGIIIAIAEQHKTTSYRGYDFDDAMDNIHSVGMSAGSCLIANTLLHLSMMRHGSVFQVIDPWLTSWYCAFAIETFLRDIALGYNVGEAYEHGIKHVGIEYLTNQWWWDIFENVVYYGDPDLRVYAPALAWDEPETVNALELKAGGHAPGGATEHPDEIESKAIYEYSVYGLAALFVVGVALVYSRKDRGKNSVGDRANAVDAVPAQSLESFEQDSEEEYEEDDLIPAELVDE